jgi:hypothetical protein
MAIGRPVTLTGNVAAKMINVLATAGQTSFTVEGGYRINQIAVYRNGVRLAQSRDFTANDGSTVTLVSAATVEDVIAYQIFDDFRVADAIVSSATAQTIDGDLTVTGTISGLTSVTGASVGIQSAGTLIGIAQTINFIGSGNTVVESSAGTLDVSISGSGGGGLGTAINYASDDSTSPFSYIDAEVTVGEDMLFDSTNAGVSSSYVVSVIPSVTIASGVAVTVGTGKTMVIDVLQIGDIET